MKITRFRANAIFSCGEIDLDLKDQGLVLVTGYSKDEGSSNGAGKSSVANKGIIWTLFGVTAGGLRADGVTNRHLERSKRQVFGEVTLTSGTDLCYTIRRERPAMLKLLLNGTEISGKTAADTQKQIDQILGFDYKTFIQTSFFGQGRTLSYASLTAKGQKEVLESILPMEEVDRWAQYANAQYKAVAGEVVKLERAADTALTRLRTLVEERASIEQYAEQFERNRQSGVEHACEQARLVDARYDSSRHGLHMELKKYEGIDDERMKNHYLENELKLKQEHSANCGLLNSAKEVHASWVQHFNVTRAAKDDLDSGRECPTCLRPYDVLISPEERERQSKFHAAKMDEASVNITQATKAIDYYRNVVNDLELQIARNHQESVEHQKMILEKIELEHKLKSLDQAKEAEKLRWEGEAEQLRSRPNPHAGQLEGIIGKVALAEQEVEIANKALAKLNGEVEHLEYWRDVYSKELKLKLFEEACPFLDARVNYHLKRLNNEQIYVQFSTVKRLANGSAKEEFNVHVQSKTGGVGFEALSGGEQQMVSFAVGLGLADLAARSAAGRSDFLILDEPFVELDARNIDSIVTYLNSEVNQGKNTILLISNDENLKGLIPNRIHVVKEGGVTTIEGQ